MALFNFLKEIGKKLVGGGEETLTADVLKKEVADLGLNVKGADITVEGDKVKVTGGNLSADEREKVILAVGNVEGVVEVEDNLATGAVFHTVQKGDNLSAIAKKTLGDANRFQEIFEANKPMLTHPDKIYPGQVLRLPSGSST